MLQNNALIESAKKTINIEIEGLNSLIDFLDDKYSAALELMISCQGRVILSGMGKSGHIAKKISATLASTGTPSFFIHPAEASHGDLGMITTKDIVILLSNSGETKELKDIIYYCKRFEIPIIGISRKSKSELENMSTIALTIPDIKETNKVNAPTTSTTMMLVLGDCIATSLLEAKGFNQENFHTFHPGGKLGSAFLRVKDIMRQNTLIPQIHDNSTMNEAIIEMTSKHLGCTAIVNHHNELIGIITDGDLRRHANNNFLQENVVKIMTKNPITIAPDSLVIEALTLMNKKSITSIFVTQNNKIIGVLHLHDCLKLGFV